MMTMGRKKEIGAGPRRQSGLMLDEVRFRYPASNLARPVRAGLRLLETYSRSCEKLIISSRAVLAHRLHRKRQNKVNKMDGVVRGRLGMLGKELFDMSVA